MIKLNVKPVPDGMHTVTPHLVCAGAADAIEFYKKAFNAVELGRMAGPQGKLMHAISGSAIRLSCWSMNSPTGVHSDRSRSKVRRSPSTSMSRMWTRLSSARSDAGAKITMPVEDMFWGDRYGKLEDPFGHHWSVATHIRDVSPGRNATGGAEMLRLTVGPHSTLFGKDRRNHAVI